MIAEAPDIQFFPPNQTVVAVDISEKMLEKARQRAVRYDGHLKLKQADVRCFRHQLLLPHPYLVLTKPLRLDIQCQRAASVKIGWKHLDD